MIHHQGAGGSEGVYRWLTIVRTSITAASERPWRHIAKGLEEVLTPFHFTTGTGRKYYAFSGVLMTAASIRGVWVFISHFFSLPFFCFFFRKGQRQQGYTREFEKEKEREGRDVQEKATSVLFEELSWRNVTFYDYCSTWYV